MESLIEHKADRYVYRRDDSAVKVLQISPRSKREVKIHCKMKHPHIIPVLELRKNRKESVYEMVMPYIPQTLFDLIQLGSLSEETARRYFFQIVSAVNYIHQRGYVHGDIKLENILYDDKKDACYLIDFGFSRPYQAGRLVSVRAGSYDYAAPELWAGRPHVGPEGDIWALAICLHGMITARFPFVLNADNLEDFQCGAMPLTLPATMSPALVQLLRLMLDPNHVSRISIDLVMTHIWNHIFEGGAAHGGREFISHEKLNCITGRDVGREDSSSASLPRGDSRSRQLQERNLDRQLYDDNNFFNFDDIGYQIRKSNSTPSDTTRSIVTPRTRRRGFLARLWRRLRS